MRKKIFLFLFVIYSVGFAQQSEVVFLQLNDIYEITPLDNGRVGGIARVASIRNELISKYGNIYTILSGDFISPSALGTSEFE